jgi:hypothetical protein
MGHVLVRERRAKSTEHSYCKPWVGPEPMALSLAKYLKNLFVLLMHDEHQVVVIRQRREGRRWDSVLRGQSGLATLQGLGVRQSLLRAL